MTQGGADMSIEQKEAPGLVDEPTNDDELCGKEIAKLKAHIGMQITIAEMNDYETFNEWFHVYPSVERYEDNLHSAWIAGAASRNAKIEAQAAQIKTLRQQLGNLLALIHRDGGQHQTEVGTEQALKDAENVWLSLRESHDALASIIEKVKEQCVAVCVEDDLYCLAETIKTLEIKL